MDIKGLLENMQNKIEFSVEKDGFYGIYYPNSKPSQYAMIAMLGDSCEDYLAKKGVKWLQSLGMNVLAMSPDKNDYSCHNLPLERFGEAVSWLKDQGNLEIGFLGASTTGMLGLLVSSYYHDISLTIAISPSDFVMEGYYQEHGLERPGNHESTVSYNGRPLPYLPFAYRHPEYWQAIKAESKRGKNMIASRELFDKSEALCPLTEDMRIKVENIRGTLVLLGAKDDCLWNTCRYIERMKKVIQNTNNPCDLHVLTYEHGTHFLFPESMLKMVLPIGSSLLSKIVFKAAHDYPKECREAHIDVDQKIKSIFNSWMQ